MNGITEEYPGLPWEHYLVKCRTHGFRCLKCSLVGDDATALREKACKIPRPNQPGSASASPTPSATPSQAAMMGASAAVVGTELAVLGCSQRADMEREKAELEKLEKELAQQIETQAIKELEEQLAELELEEQIAEYQVYETEEQMLTRALRESLEEARAFDDIFDDGCPGLGDAAGECDERASREVMPMTNDMPPPPPVEKRKKPVEPSTMPSPKKSKVTADKPDEIPVLSPKSQKPYQKFWSRFVATPQMCNRAGPTSSN